MRLLFGNAKISLCSFHSEDLELTSIGLSAWRKHHDLVAVASAIGLHSYTEPPQATFRSEMRKRLSACCFWNDKDISMFTGRPPAWSHRYHTCPLVLDVSDDALIEGGERLQQEIDNLDANGWNTKGKVHAATRARSMALSAVLLDEIMEIFIGTPAQFSMNRVRFVCSLENKVVCSLTLHTDP